MTARSLAKKVLVRTCKTFGIDIDMADLSLLRKAGRVRPDCVQA